MTPDVDTGSGSERGLPPPKERRRLRESGELTHEQVATELGVTAGTVRAWETGRTEPGARTRQAYAELLDRLARAGAGPGRSAGPHTRPGRAAKRAPKPPSAPARPAARPAAARPAAARPAAARLDCRAALTAAERDAHFQIRRQVFVAEQGMFGGAGGDPASGHGGDPASGPGGDSVGGDRDDHDDDPATIHVVGLADGVVCGTVRLYPLGPDGQGRWKGDRLAVLASHRHLGLGAPLVRFAVSSAGRLGGREMEAFIQPANVAFFRWLGWRRTGDLVDYAGIPHQRMLIDLTRP